MPNTTDPTTTTHAADMRAERTDDARYALDMAAFHHAAPDARQRQHDTHGAADECEACGAIIAHHYGATRLADVAPDDVRAIVAAMRARDAERGSAAPLALAVASLALLALLLAPLLAGAADALAVVLGVLGGAA